MLIGVIITIINCLAVIIGLSLLFIYYTDSFSSATSFSEMAFVSGGGGGGGGGAGIGGIGSGLPTVAQQAATQCGIPSASLRPQVRFYLVHSS